MRAFFSARILKASSTGLAPARQEVERIRTLLGGSEWDGPKRPRAIRKRSTKWSMDTATSLVRRRSLRLDGGAELGEPVSGQVGPVRRREVLEQALVGRDGRLLLAGELLVPCEPQEEVLVEEVPGRQPLERRLEGLDRLREVALGLPGVGDAGQAGNPERAGGALGERHQEGTAGGRVLALHVPEVPELVGSLDGGDVGRILGEGRF